MSGLYDVAVVGATGLVGETLLALLHERAFPVRQLFALDSGAAVERSAVVGGEPLTVGAVEHFDFARCDIVLLAAGAHVAARYAPRAVAAGAIAIDGSGAFREADDVPLVVPEINADQIGRHASRGIVASPGSATIPLVLALAPLHAAAGVERVNVATYQAVSCGGRAAIESLTDHTRQLLAGLDPIVRGNGKWVAFNAVPAIDGFEPNGYTKQEMNIVRETRKILADPKIMVNPTAVRVPVFFGHSAAVHIETRTKVTVEAVQKLLNCAPGVIVMDGRVPGMYPTPAIDAAHRDAVYVGRLREDISHPRGLDFWVVSDNVRKGAALNMVQTAEVLVKQFM